MLAREAARVAHQQPRTADFTHNVLRARDPRGGGLFPGLPDLRGWRGTPTERRSARSRLGDQAGARAVETEVDPSVFDFVCKLLSGDLVARAAQRIQPPRGAALRHEAAAVQRPGDGQGPGRHRLLSLQPVCRAERGRRAIRISLGFGFQLPQGECAAREALAELDADHVHARYQARRGHARAPGGYCRRFPTNGPSRRSSGAVCCAPGGRDRSSAPPDRNDEYLFYQLLTGSWPVELIGSETSRSGGAGGVQDAAEGRDDEIHPRGESAHHMGVANTAYEDAVTDVHRRRAGPRRLATRSWPHSFRFRNGSRASECATAWSRQR